MANEGRAVTSVVRWGTAQPLRVRCSPMAGETPVRAFGTATVAGSEPNEQARLSIREAIIGSLGEVLAELDRPPQDLPPLCAEAARLTLPKARSALMPRGIELSELTIEGLAVPEAPMGERQLTPEPSVPSPVLNLNLGGLMGMALPGMAGMSATAGAEPVREGAPPELGELIRTGRSVPHAQSQDPGNPALLPYLQWFLSSQSLIPWALIDSYAAEFFHPDRMSPEALLVSLDTDQSRPLNEAEFGALMKACPSWSPSGLTLPTRPLTASEALGCHNRVLLIGDTGSGKTLTAKVLCGRLARWALGQGGAPEGWSGGARVPVYLRLGELFRGRQNSGPIKPDELLQAAERSGSQPPAAGAMESLAGVPDGGLLWVLDGLDELRDMALEWTLAGLDNLMSSRAEDSVWVLSRNEPAMRGVPALAGLARARLLPLDAAAENLYLRFVEPSRIEAMVRGWYQRAAERELLSEKKALESGESLLRALQDSGLRQIATRPLLLAKMILFQTTRDPLPDNSAVFCREAASLLASRWAQGRSDYELRSYDPVTPQHMEAALGWVATALWKRGEVVDGRHVLDMAELVRELTPLTFGKAGTAQGTLELLLARGGLLTEVTPGKIGFVYQAMLKPCQTLGVVG